jgi:chromosome segregation ATPase
MLESQVETLTKDLEKLNDEKENLRFSLSSEIKLRTNSERDLREAREQIHSMLAQMTAQSQQQQQQQQQHQQQQQQPQQQSPSQTQEETTFEFDENLSSSNNGRVTFGGSKLYENSRSNGSTSKPTHVPPAPPPPPAPPLNSPPLSSTTLNAIKKNVPKCDVQMKPVNWVKLSKFNYSDTIWKEVITH